VFGQEFQIVIDIDIIFFAARLWVVRKSSWRLWCLQNRLWWLAICRWSLLANSNLTTPCTESYCVQSAKTNKFGHLIALMVKECPICFEVTRICKEICLLSVCLWIHLETWGVHRVHVPRTGEALCSSHRRQLQLRPLRGVWALSKHGNEDNEVCSNLFQRIRLVKLVKAPLFWWFQERRQTMSLEDICGYITNPEVPVCVSHFCETWIDMAHCSGSSAQD